MEPKGYAIGGPLFELVRAVVSNRDATVTIFALSNRFLESSELQIMILYLNRQTLGAGFFGQTFWDSPALEYAVLFEPKIKMMTPRVMFLDNKSPWIEGCHTFKFWYLCGSLTWYLETMRAMVLTQQKSVEELPLTQREMDAPRAGPGEVRVKVSVCAVCCTDLHIIEGDLEPHRMPVIPGHQIVGRVDETVDGVVRLRVGRRIGIAWLQHVDSTCQFCRRGRENLCHDSRYTGYDVDGGHAEYAVVPEDFAYELPEYLDDEHISPLLCARLIGYRALQRATVPERGRLLLVGFGSSAHIVIQIAVHRMHEIWVVTRSENHIRQARELGAAWAGYDFRDVPGKADGAVLFAPSGKLVPPTLEALDRGAVCSIAGIHLSDVPRLDYRKHFYQERELLSVTANTREDLRAFSPRPSRLTSSLARRPTLWLTRIAAYSI
jgi:propanol-preferring alcohol dehydrogenase